MQWFFILFTAVIVEGLIAYVNMVIEDKKIHWKVIASAIIGVTVTVCYGIDLFAIVKATTAIPYIGSVMTGILISRGSNYIHDLLKKITGVKIISEEISQQHNRPFNEINIDIVDHEV